MGIFKFDYEFATAQKKHTSCPLRKGKTTGGFIRTAFTHHVNGYTVRKLPLQRKTIFIEQPALQIYGYYDHTQSSYLWPIGKECCYF